ncbi:MAG: hypothetical protein ABH863_03050 [Candidatus Micrarchaeota archaeon]
MNRLLLIAILAVSLILIGCTQNKAPIVGNQTSSPSISAENQPTISPVSPIPSIATTEEFCSYQCTPKSIKVKFIDAEGKSWALGETETADLPGGNKISVDMITVSAYYKKGVCIPIDSITFPSIMDKTNPPEKKHRTVRSALANSTIAVGDLVSGTFGGPLSFSHSNKGEKIVGIECSYGGDGNCTIKWILHDTNFQVEYEPQKFCQPVPKKGDYIPGGIIVRFVPGTTLPEALQILKKNGVSPDESFITTDPVLGDMWSPDIVGLPGSVKVGEEIEKMNALYQEDKVTELFFHYLILGIG